MLRALFRPRLPKYKREPLRLNLKITVVVEKDGEGFYTYAPALKGVHVYDDTEETALKHVTDAIGVYLWSLARHGDSLPIGPDFSAQREVEQEVPANAFSRNVMVSWPTAQMSGTS